MESSTKSPETLVRKISVRDKLLTASFFLSILIAGVFLTPTTEAVFLFGWQIPELCTSKRFFDIDCLGCGLTRSVSFTMHGNFHQAWEMNILGIPITMLFAFIGLRNLYQLIFPKH